MDLRNEAITDHRAVREYTAEPLDEQTIRLLIADAAQAPSAINEQPWTFTVVPDRALLNRASHQAKAHMLATRSASVHRPRRPPLCGRGWITRHQVLTIGLKLNAV